MRIQPSDTNLLRDMLALGGAALRDQLVADLDRCAELLHDACASDGACAETRRRVLHELRGIALTIGADRLAGMCQYLETTVDTAGADWSDDCMRAVAACRTLARQIAASKDESE